MAFITLDSSFLDDVLIEAVARHSERRIYPSLCNAVGGYCQSHLRPVYPWYSPYYTREAFMEEQSHEH